MGRQPYLYQPVTHSVPFNPKAYSQSVIQQQAAPPRRKPDGPLITFNRHPDSYDNLPYGRHVGVEEMSKGSKKRILVMRKVQLAFRILEWIVAVGVMVCVIMMKGVPDTQGWILRLPPAFDLAIQAYAVWHLCRSPTQHPPASAASYHAFALIMDIGVIPFYTFTGVLSNTQHNAPYGAEFRWRSMLANETGDNMILQVSMLTSLVAAGMHVITLVISTYLVIKFRQIADLPPDMNPLEDNLTKRTKSKHKYKNSDMTDITLIGNDKRFSEISARDSNRTLCEQDQLRMSQTSEKLMGTDPRASGVSFFSSRDSNGHAYSYSPHNPETARHSWHRSSVNQSPYGNSDIGLNIYAPHSGNNDRQSKHRSQQSRPASEYIEERYGNSRTMSPMPNAPRITKRSSATPASPIPIYDENTSNNETNWEVMSGRSSTDDGTGDDFDPYRHTTKATTARNSKLGYGQVAQQEEADISAQLSAPAYHDVNLNDDGSPSQPLRMHPPTPEPTHPHALPTSPLSRLSRGYDQQDKENDERTQTMMTQSSSVYSDTETELSTIPAGQGQGQGGHGKSRFYTDLAAAMRGVRHHQPTSHAPKSVAGSVHTHISSSTTASSKVAPATLGDKRIKPSGTVVRKPLKSFDEGNGLQMGYTLGKASPSRVVSRTGVDVVEGDLGLGMGGRRRDVSGKVVEEGRSQGMWRRISGRKASSGSRGI